MNNSLQDQLLKAGLVDKKQAKKVSKEKRKQNNVSRRQKDEVIDENKQAIEKNKKEKQARDKELNAQRQAEAEKKSLQAQIFQLTEHYQLKNVTGDIEYNFKDGTTIKRMHLNQESIDELARGRLCIIQYKNESYKIVPKPIAERIEKRAPEYVILANDPNNDNNTRTDSDSDDAYYAQFEIPDDLVW